jgi:hypothetical protein
MADKPTGDPAVRDNHEPEQGSGHQLMGSAWFLTELDEATESRITEIVRRAVV